MKKTYASPSVTISGDAIHETKGGSPPPTDIGGVGQGMGAGAVGFNL